MPLAQAVAILQKHCRIIKNVQVLYSEQVSCGQLFTELASLASESPPKVIRERLANRDCYVPVGAFSALVSYYVYYLLGSKTLGLGYLVLQALEEQ